MSNNMNEGGVIHFKAGGHNHDGENSTKIDFSQYTEEDLAYILEKVKGQGTLPVTTTTNSSANDSIFYHMSGVVELSADVVAHKIILYPADSLKIIATLGTAGTTETKVTIYKNGGSIGTVNIAAGQGVELPVTITIISSFNGTSDNVSARVTSAGATAYELGIEIIAIPKTN